MSIFNFWKHKVNGQVISDDCKSKLPAQKQLHYEPTSTPATHVVESVERTDEDDDGFVTSLIASAAIESIMDSDSLSDISTTDDSNNDSSDFGGFDGGSSGGGGADDTW